MGNISSESKSLRDIADDVAGHLETAAGRGGREVSGEQRVPSGNGKKSGQWTTSATSAYSNAGKAGAERAPKDRGTTNGDPDEFFDTVEPLIHSMAERIGIPESWILGLSAYESGWLDDHNRKLNNPFGLTDAGTGACTNSDGRAIERRNGVGDTPSQITAIAKGTRIVISRA